MSGSIRSFPTRAREALRLCGTGWAAIVRSASMATLATLLQLVSLTLFLPLVRSLLTGDLGRLDRFLPISQWLPQERFGNAATLILVAVILVATLARVGAGYLANLWAGRAESVAAARLEQLLLQAFLKLGPAYHDHEPTAKTTRLAHRLPLRVARVVRMAHQGVESLLSLLFFLAALALLSWPLATIAAVALVGYIAAYGRAAARLEAMADEVDDVEDAVTARTHDLLANLPLVWVHGTTAHELERARLRSEELAAVRTRQERLLGLLDPIRDVAGILLLLGFALLVANLPRGLIAAEITRYLIFFLVFRRAMAKFSLALRLPRMWQRIDRGLGRLEELFALSELTTVVSGPVRFEGLEDGIEARDLTFGYTREEPVLRGLRLVFPAQTKTWIVGPTGSGKSTLLKLLVRAYDCPAGALFLDGRDLRSYELTSLLARTAYASGEPMFFDDTVRANVTYGLSNVEESRIWAIAEAVQAADVIRNLPRGLDQSLGEQGLLLSTGERQRLGLLRALLRPAELVLLDEATSGLDAVTEATILEALDEITGGRTVIHVAHRLSNIRANDRVLVLAGGQVLEEGPRNRLLSDDGELRRLWVAQKLPLPAPV